MKYKSSFEGRVNFKQGAGAICATIVGVQLYHQKPGHWSPLENTKNLVLSQAHVASDINIPIVPPIATVWQKGSSYQTMTLNSSSSVVAVVTEGELVSNPPNHWHPAIISSSPQFDFTLRIPHKDKSLLHRLVVLLNEHLRIVKHGDQLWSIYPTIKSEIKHFCNASKLRAGSFQYLVLKLFSF